MAKKKSQRVIIREYIKMRNRAIKLSYTEYKKPFDYLLRKMRKSEQFFFENDWLEFSKYLSASFTKSNVISFQEIMKFYTGVYGFKSKKDKKLIEVIQNKALEEYSKKHVAKKVKSITKTTQKRINKIVSAGQSAGKNRKDIAKELISSIQGMKKNRAMTIARTESANSTSYINHSSLSELGLKRKWVHVGGGKTDRAEHVACDNEVIKEKEVYSCGLSYPHEPGADPGDVINCYCLEIMAI